MKPPLTELETDPRFPSGAWTGYFLQRRVPGRHLMELLLTFAAGRITGSGRDWVGAFQIEGNYQLSDGRCAWRKQYFRKHPVYYHGFNEGKGIWGTWEIRPPLDHETGGFHIWPEGVGTRRPDELAEELDLPATAAVDEEIGSPLASPAVGSACRRVLHHPASVQ